MSSEEILCKKKVQFHFPISIKQKNYFPRNKKRKKQQNTEEKSLNLLQANKMREQENRISWELILIRLFSFSSGNFFLMWREDGDWSLRFDLNVMCCEIGAVCLLIHLSGSCMRRSNRFKSVGKCIDVQKRPN